MKQKARKSRMWYDVNGNPAVLQPANLPLTLWLVTYVGNLFFARGGVHQFFDVAGFGLLFTWSFMEITKGDSYSRQILGAIIMLVIIGNRL